jgi:hypothetical protein
MLSRIEAKYDPRRGGWDNWGVREILEPFIDVSAAVADHQRVDWQALSDTFPENPLFVYANPTFAEYIDAAWAGAVQLHADAYLQAQAALITTVEDAAEDAFIEAMSGRPVSKDLVLPGMRGRYENEAKVLSRLEVEVPILDAPGKNTLDGQRSTQPVPASLFTSLPTAQALYEGSRFQLKGNYLPPREGDRHVKDPILTQPYQKLLIPRGRQPVAA